MIRFARAVIAFGLLLCVWVTLEGAFGFQSRCGQRSLLFVGHALLQAPLMAWLFAHLFDRHGMQRPQWDIGSLLLATMMVSLTMAMGRLVPVTFDRPGGFHLGVVVAYGFTWLPVLCCIEAITYWLAVLWGRYRRPIAVAGSGSDSAGSSVADVE